MTDEALRAIEAKIARGDYRGLLEDAARLVEALREAREWVRRMVRETQELRCAFCGEVYPPETNAYNDEGLCRHIRICPQHPMRALETERDAARAAKTAAETSELACASELDEVRARYARLVAALETIDELTRFRSDGVAHVVYPVVREALAASPTDDLGLIRARLAAGHSYRCDKYDMHGFLDSAQECTCQHDALAARFGEK